MIDHSQRRRLRVDLRLVLGGRVVAQRDEGIGDSISFLCLGEVLPHILELILKIPHFIIIKMGDSGNDGQMKAVAVIFIVMDNNAKYQTLLISAKTTPQQIEQYCRDFDKTKMSLMLDIFVHIHQILNGKAEPHMKLNSVLMMLAFARLAHYPSLVFIQSVMIGFVAEPAKVAARNDNHQIYDYFETEGYSASIPNLQSLSFHYTRHCMILILLLAYLQPKRMYKNREFNVPSHTKKLEEDLFQCGLNEQQYNQIVTAFGFLNLRKEFLKNLISFAKRPDEYVQSVIKAIEKYLVSNTKTPLIDCIITLLKSHEAYLCTELVPRLAEIFCYHNNFRVKKDCLGLINEILFSGDLEAVVILNFTQYFKIVALKVADASIHVRFNKLVIFPQINGQVDEKRLFLNEFLLTVERLAKLFPTLEAYFLNSGESPISQIHQKLIECNARFPKWQAEQQFYMRVSNNFRLNKEYNLMFLDELDKQKVEWLVIDPLHPTYRNLLYFIQRNLDNFKKICSQKDLNPNDNEWMELVEFKKHFQEMLERMTDDIGNEEIDELIWRGLNLKSNINVVEQAYSKFERGEFDKAKLIEHLVYSEYQEDQSIRRRMEQLGTYIKKREKESIQVAINEKQSIIKSKVNLRIQELASKKNDSCKSISQLDIYSRSFIANNLHSEEIIKEFMPIVYFHPLRKQKRMNNGIRICSEESATSPQHKEGTSTPKFRSYMMQQPKKMKKGLKVVQKQGAKYERYLQVLSRREWIKHLTAQSMTVLDKGWVKIERSQIKSSNLLDKQILQVTFSCFAAEGADVIRYSINQQPSVEIKSKRKMASSNKYEIEIKALWIKFGYSLPSITFHVKDQIVEIPLPFSFNNYLSITPIKKDQKRNPKSSQRHRLDKQEFPYIQSVKNYLRGIKIQGNKLSGSVKFFNWQCNLRILFEGETFVVELDPLIDRQDDILLNFLPLFLVRLLSVGE